MTEEQAQDTQETAQQPQHDPNSVLCRIVDVDKAMQNSFQLFLSGEEKTLEVLTNIIRDELSKIELFVPNMQEDSTTNENQ